MNRTVHLSIMALALVALVLVGGQAGGKRSAAAYATPAVTAQPTAAATEEAVETEAPDAQATDEGTPADEGPITFVKSPAPDAGSIGITLSSDDPVAILSVYPEGPAEKAGLQPGDEIVAVNGKEMTDREAIVAAIVATKPGDTIAFTVTRDGEKQDIEVPVATRRGVYCPVPEPKVTEGAAIVKDPMSAAKNWTLAADTTKGVKQVVGDGKLTYTTAAPDKSWVGLSTLRGKSVADFALTTDITQTGPAIAGILLAYNPRAGSYSVQFAPNGSWSMSATVDGQSSPGGLSFSEPDLKAEDENDPASSVTNKVKIITQGDNIFFYFNDKFACGASQVIFADPPLEAGGVGLYAVVGADQSGKAGVSFSNFSQVAVK